MAQAPTESGDSARLVGSDRVLAVLIQLAQMPAGASLDELAQSIGDAKPTVHRALAALTRAGLASKQSRGRYILGDAFLRLAFTHAEARPEGIRVRPLLAALADRFGETAHYAVLDGETVVYRAKQDPGGGAVRLTSMIGGTNPAHSTGVGKALLAERLLDLAAVVDWKGARELEGRTPNTATTAEDLFERLSTTRERGFAVDDQENEAGINCVAFAISLGSPAVATGAVSVSALAYRTPLATLVDAAAEIQAMIADAGAALVRA